MRVLSSAYRGATKGLYWALISAVGFFLTVGVLTTGIAATHYEQVCILLGDFFEIQKQERFFAQQAAVKK